MCVDIVTPALASLSHRGGSNLAFLGLTGATSAKGSYRMITDIWVGWCESEVVVHELIGNMILCPTNWYVKLIGNHNVVIKE